MIKLIIQFLFCSIMLFNLRVNAEDIESLKLIHMEIVLKCAKDYPLSPEDKENEIAKCVLACTYKGTGMMDDQGMLSVEGVNELARNFLSQDPKLLKKAENFTDACKSVNDVEVSDGEKGCERAALIFKCNFEKAPEINDKALFNADKGQELTQKFIANEDDQQKTADIIKTCLSVNEDVSDGEKGCNRAKLLFDCLLPLQTEFGKTR